MSNIDQLDYRKNMCDILFKELEFFKEKMGVLMLNMKNAKINEEALKKMDGSIKLIIKIVDIYLRNDVEYIKEEDPETFGAYMNNIEEAIKAFFISYIIANNLQNILKYGRKYFVRSDNGKNFTRFKKYTDSIDRLCYLMYDSLSEKKGLFKVDANNTLIKDDSMEYAYPSVVRAIKFVKNKQHHEKIDVPIDYRTDVKAFGNLFTLCSMLILVFNAYIEMLEDWLETI